MSEDVTKKVLNIELTVEEINHILKVLDESNLPHRVVRELSNKIVTQGSVQLAPAPEANAAPAAEGTEIAPATTTTEAVSAA